MNILGISLQHDAGAAIIIDGRIITAINEERLNRQKLYWGWPERAITEVIRQANVHPQDIDAVTIANTTHSTNAPNWEGFYPKDAKRRALIRLSQMGLARLVGGTQMGIAAYKIFNSKKVRSSESRNFARKLHNQGIQCPIYNIDHHKAHLASAYYTSGWDNCLNISLDGVGDGYCSRIAVCKDGKMDLIHSIPFYHTPGQYYGFVTGWAGFTPGKHEGKITGLAAYGDAEKAIDIFRSRIGYSEKKFSFVNHGMWGWAEYEHINKKLKGIDKADAAAAIQQHIEDLITRYVTQAVTKTKHTKIVLSGGLFANVKLNQRVRDIAGVEDIYVHPNMGDGGLAVGAALAYCGENTRVHPYRLENAYLGTEGTEADIESELKKQGLSYTRHDNVEAVIAQRLAQGLVVARVNGKMEYGPRALGNRSIIYQATDVTVNKWLNQHLKRTEFMPFAPAILKERAADYYVGFPTSEFTAEFMTITYDVTKRCQEEAPAVVHVDNTARPQIVSKQSNPSFYHILTEYEKLTGFPQLINTSFNMHEEPIVCTPEDAVRAFQQGHLDVLAIGAYIVDNPEAKPHKQKQQQNTLIQSP
ncbi:MAG: carbamoyltransferase [Candidatus Latescibacteria bacterium]|nr:carbamoyltransferase [Candidatus Latescibacterota bacterium]MBT4138822.1 carbamoyltransferase [Candidatus Latescibacterota bacterium]MBT5830187.1 carbamoyltransferase [Candidatus Latescibacterota bacterium]